MTALAKALSWATGIDADYYSAQLKTIAMFCGFVLFVWLLFATYGLDLSPGFFLTSASQERGTEAPRPSRQWASKLVESNAAISSIVTMSMSK